MLRVGKQSQLPPIDKVSFKLNVEPDDYQEIAGSFDDPADVAWVKRELKDGNEWAWCSVEVRAEWWNRKTGKTYSGVAYLGGCSYESEASFKQPGGYYDDMKKEAYDDLVSNIEDDNYEDEGGYEEENG